MFKKAIDQGLPLLIIVALVALVAFYSNYQNTNIQEQSQKQLSLDLAGQAGRDHYKATKTEASDRRTSTVTETKQKETTRPKGKVAADNNDNGQGCVYGDTDFDGKHTSFDVNCYQKYLVKTSECIDAVPLECVDLDCNGKVTIADALSVNYKAGTGKFDGNAKANDPNKKVWIDKDNNNVPDCKETEVQKPWCGGFYILKEGESVLTPDEKEIVKVTKANQYSCEFEVGKGLEKLEDDIDEFDAINLSESLSSQHGFIYNGESVVVKLKLYEAFENEKCVFDVVIDWFYMNNGPSSKCFFPKNPSTCSFKLAKDTVLTQDLVATSSGVCINSGLTLDCKGRKIIGSYNDLYTHGIIVSDADGVKNHATIKNCEISGFTNGVFVWDGDETEISNNNIHNNHKGIYYHFSQDNYLESNNINNNNEGVFHAFNGVIGPDAPNELNLINNNVCFNTNYDFDCRDVKYPSTKISFFGSGNKIDNFNCEETLQPSSAIYNSCS